MSETRLPRFSLGGDRAALERAGGHQAADGGRIDVVGIGVRLCLALPEVLQRLVTLMRGELAWTSEANASCEVLGGSILPEVVEAVAAQLGVLDCVLNVAVAQEVLQRAGIDAVIGKLEPAAMAQHVRMNGEGKFGQFLTPADHFEEPGPRHWAAAFGIEHVAALQVLPSHLAQCPDFLAGFVNWRQHEPTLEDILSDSIIKAVMKADGVDPHQLAAMLKEVGRRWAGAHTRVLPTSRTA